MPGTPSPQTDSTPKATPIRFSIGSILLLTTCCAVMAVATNHYGPPGVVISVYWFYLALPILAVTFIDVSVTRTDRIASDRVFAFFAVIFAAAFFWFGAVWPNGTLAACVGPIVIWPPQVFAIVYFQSRMKRR